MDAAVLLEAENVEVVFDRRARAVKGVDLSVRAGEAFALVGESGCGKTALATALPRLHDPRRTAVSGSVRFAGQDLYSLSEKEMRGIRGLGIGMVFQDPMNSLNPLMRVGDQVYEAARRRCPSDSEARRRVLDLFAQAGIPDPEIRSRRYPHEFSGGMLQRVMIIAALAGGPRLLLADEPTTALDVTVQARVLSFLDRMRAELGLALVLVSHDLGVVARHTERAAVMYAGRIVESAPTGDLIAAPAHPYTEGLLRSLPRRGSRGRPLRTIEGFPPSPLEREAPGCAFAPRCPYRNAACLEERPVLAPLPPAAAAFRPGAARLSACLRAGELDLGGAL